MASYANQHVHDTDQDYTKELNNDAKSRQRFRPTVLDMFKNMRDDVGICFTTYWLALGPRVRRVAHLVFKQLRIFDLVSDKHLLYVLGKLNQLAKRGREKLFGPFWTYFAELTTLRDVELSLPDKDFIHDITRWVSGSIDHQYDTDIPFTFREAMNEGLSTFLNSGDFKLSDLQPLSPEEFCSDPGYWARSGTSDGPRLEIETQNGRKRARKSKWASALAMTPDQVYSLMMRKEHQRNEAIQKRERKKVRAIISSDLSTYLKMSYVDIFIQWLLKSSPYTTLFLNTKRQYLMWKTIIEDTDDPYALKFPLDQEEFDHNVSMTMLMDALTAIENTILRLLLTEANTTQQRQFGDSLLYVMNLIRYALSAGHVLVKGRKIQVTKGIMSGWRWTAFLDSLINFAQLYAINKAAEFRFNTPIISGVVVQGDDIRTKVPGPGGALTLLAGYQEVGLKVMAAKVFAAYHADEFLRQVATPGRLAGYPARSVGAICFRNPVTRTQAIGELRIREGLEQWGTLAARAMSEPKFIRTIAIPDVARANKLSPTDLEDYMRTPCYAGGLGMTIEPSSRPMRLLRIEEPEERWSFKGVPPGISAFCRRYKLPFSEVSKVWRPNIEAPPKSNDTFGTLILAPSTVRIERTLSNVKITAQPPFTPTTMPVVQGLPPTLVTVIKNMAVRYKSRALVHSIIDPAFANIENRIWQRWSRRLYWDWVSTGINFATPLVLGRSGTQVAMLSEQIIQSLMSWLLGRVHFVTQSLVNRALATYEYYVVAAAPQLQPEMCG